MSSVQKVQVIQEHGAARRMDRGRAVAINVGVSDARFGRADRAEHDDAAPFSAAFGEVNAIGFVAFGDDAATIRDGDVHAGFKLDGDARVDGERDSSGNSDAAADGNVGVPGRIRGDGTADATGRRTLNKVEIDNLNKIAAAGFGGIQTDDGKNVRADGEPGTDSAEVDHFGGFGGRIAAGRFVVGGGERVERWFSWRAGAVKAGKIITIEPGDKTVIEIGRKLKVKCGIDRGREVARFVHCARRIDALSF